MAQINGLSMSISTRILFSQSRLQKYWKMGLKSLLKPKIEAHGIFPLYLGILSLNSLIFLLFILKIIFFLFGCYKIRSLIGHL